MKGGVSIQFKTASDCVDLHRDSRVINKEAADASFVVCLFRDR